VIGTFGISRDITDRKQAEAAMLQAAKEAARQPAGQERFPGEHESRDPHAVECHHRHDRTGAGYPVTESQRDYLKMVLVSSESLLSVINDILDFAKIEAGKLDLLPTEFDLRESWGMRCGPLLSGHTQRAWNWPAESIPTPPTA
jgi:two-component system, sensor histidine kinase and response regulator